MCKRFSTQMLKQFLWTPEIPLAENWLDLKNKNEKKRKQPPHGEIGNFQLFCRY